MDSQHCHHHQRLSIREIGGEQKRMKKTLPGSSYHLCRARESGGDGDKQTKRTGLAAWSKCCRIYLLICSRQFCHHHQGQFYSFTFVNHGSNVQHFHIPYTVIIDKWSGDVMYSVILDKLFWKIKLLHQAMSELEVWALRVGPVLCCWCELGLLSSKPSVCWLRFLHKHQPSGGMFPWH